MARARVPVCPTCRQALEPTGAPGETWLRYTLRHLPPETREWADGVLRSVGEVTEPVNYIGAFIVALECLANDIAARRPLAAERRWR